MKDSSRRFDIIIYGVTGFTGKLVAEYFTRNVDRTQVNWAIAGRNERKLQEVISDLKQISNAAENLEYILADTSDIDDMSRLAESAKIILSTVGPYALHGEALVSACVEAGTHCLDLAGEPDYVQHIYKHYDFKAARNGALIVNSCGFDSVPADLGTFFTAQQLPAGTKKIQGYISGKGTFSGGTLSSAIGILEQLTEEAILDPKYKFGPASFDGVHYRKAIGKWALPMPVVDPQIVRRSSRLRPDIYGPDFSYGQYLGADNPVYAGGIAIGAGALLLASKFEASRNLLLGWRESGEGPDEVKREQSHFRVDLIGQSGETTVRCSVSGGDPGYGETSKMISEAALTILEQYDQLPVKGGVVTPAGALGELYLERLQKKGVRFSVEG